MIPDTVEPCQKITPPQDFVIIPCWMGGDIRLHLPPRSSEVSGPFPLVEITRIKNVYVGGYDYGDERSWEAEHDNFYLNGAGVDSLIEFLEWARSDAVTEATIVEDGYQENSVWKPS